MERDKMARAVRMTSQGSLKIVKNSLANLIRLGAAVLAALVLPPFLTRHLSHDIYAAWVLILQFGAYAAIFELGLQSGISKFVAQHHAAEDHEGTSRVVSTATVLLGISAVLALFAMLILVWQVPHFFPQLTPALIHEVRVGILFVGGATALALPTTALASSFQGVQRYNIPMAIQALAQTLSVVAIIVAVLLHGNLVVMGACVATVTLGAGLVQIAAWRRSLAHIRVTAALVKRRTAQILIAFCASMSIWAVGMLLISGLDTTIVGHFDFKQTGFYAVAASLTNFLIVTAGAIFGPLLPASSELAAVGDHARLASLTLRSTRYCAVLLVLTALPLLLYGYPILSLWVGTDYARHSLFFLQILTTANMIRLCMLPYALIVAGNGLQRYGWAAAIGEAVVNFGCSIELSYHFGAAGVALGTLIGAALSVMLHLSYTMRRTRSAIPVNSIEFMLEGLAMPLACAIPFFSFFFFCRGNPSVHGFLPPVLIVLLTVFLLWSFGLTRSDRAIFTSALRNWQIRRVVRA